MPEAWAGAAFRIGSSHSVCEDYACAMGGMVAVSDGCSSGENTDIGARLLARVALRLALAAGDLDPIGRQASIVARTGANLVAAGHSSLLATLLLARAEPQGFSAHCWGDGFVLFEDEGDWTGWRIEWPNEAPHYPVYRHPPEAPGLARPVGAGAFRYEEHRAVVSGFSYHHTTATAVALLSDGFSSFSDDTGAKVPDEDVLAELFPIRLLGPGFVNRRLAAFERRRARLGWKHHDDISMAVIKGVT